MQAIALIVLVVFTAILGCARSRRVLTEASIVSTPYFTERVTGITCRQLFDYPFAWQNRIVSPDTLKRLEEVLGARRAKWTPLPFDVDDQRIALTLRWSDGSVDTMCFGGTVMRLNERALDLDSILVTSVGEMLPERHRESLRRALDSTSQ